MINLCTSFNDCSAYVKKWLTNQPGVKEESLTEWWLYELSEKIPIIKCKLFTRWDEGREKGADWEWWFLFPNKRSFAARIQAKRLKPKVNNFGKIAYKGAGNKLQIERLLDNSAKDGFASFYVFYSNEHNPDTMCGGRSISEGVFLGEASRLHHEFIVKSKLKLMPVDILKFTNPISCLFCCPMTSKTGSNIEEGFKEHIENYYLQISDNINENSNRQELGFRNTPDYILKMVEGENIPDSWEREYRSYFKGIKALVVIDLQNPDKYTFSTSGDMLSHEIAYADSNYSKWYKGVR